MGVSLCCSTSFAAGHNQIVGRPLDCITSAAKAALSAARGLGASLCSAIVAARITVSQARDIC